MLDGHTLDQVYRYGYVEVLFDHTNGGGHPTFV